MLLLPTDLLVLKDLSSKGVALVSIYSSINLSIYLSIIYIYMCCTVPSGPRRGTPCRRAARSPTGCPPAAARHGPCCAAPCTTRPTLIRDTHRGEKEGLGGQSRGGAVERRRPWLDDNGEDWPLGEGLCGVKVVESLQRITEVESLRWWLLLCDVRGC